MQQVLEHRVEFYHCNVIRISNHKINCQITNYYNFTTERPIEFSIQIPAEKQLHFKLLSYISGHYQVVTSPNYVRFGAFTLLLQLFSPPGRKEKLRIQLILVDFIRFSYRFIHLNKKEIVILQDYE